jgi:hypothetical protein
MMKKNVLLTISAVLILTLVSFLPAVAEDEKPTADLSVSILSAYIWRGQELSKDSAVVQPSMTVGYKGFSVNIWGNLDTDPYSTTEGENNPSKWNETDLTLSYARSFGIFTAEGGYIYYGLDGVKDSEEVFLALSFDTPLLSPSLTAYRDVGSYPHWYFLLGISHSFKITDKVFLELSASASYLKSEDSDDYPKINDSGASTDNKFKDFHDGVISASLPISLTEYISVTPVVSYTFPLSDDASDEMEWRSKNGNDDAFVYGGLTLSMSF